MSSITLRLPKLEDENVFNEALEATHETDRNFLHYYEAGMKFADWVQRIEDISKGKNLPEGHVPATFLFGFLHGTIIGRLSIRHRLNEEILQVGGHIGYVVVPVHRRRGYAVEMLNLALPIAKELGISRVLLTCDEGNIGSQKTIERCGGKLENIVSIPDTTIRKMRYWIDLSER